MRRFLVQSIGITLAAIVFLFSPPGTMYAQTCVSIDDQRSGTCKESCNPPEEAARSTVCSPLVCCVSGNPPGSSSGGSPSLGAPPAQLSGLEDIFRNTVSIVLSFAGIVFFIMLVVGGFKFITAGGEAPKVEGAKKTLTFAILGLVFIVLAFFFLRFIEVFTNVNVSQFKITQ